MTAVLILFSCANISD